MAQWVKNPPAMQEAQVRMIPWRRKWQFTPVFLPGEFHRQRSLVDCGASCRRESDMTEAIEHTSFLLSETTWPESLRIFVGQLVS